MSSPEPPRTELAEATGRLSTIVDKNRLLMLVNDKAKQGSPYLPLFSKSPHRFNRCSRPLKSRALPYHILIISHTPSLPPQ